jgi:hypothetical protein
MFGDVRNFFPVVDSALVQRYHWNADFDGLTIAWIGMRSS